MPKEILSSTDTSKILSSEKLRCTDAVTEMSHSEIVYETVVEASDKLKCDTCENGAKFIHHTRDHLGQNFVAIVCASCAPPGYEKLSQLRSEG